MRTSMPVSTALFDYPGSQQRPSRTSCGPLIGRSGQAPLQTGISDIRGETKALSLAAGVAWISAGTGAKQQRLSEHFVPFNGVDWKRRAVGAASSAVLHPLFTGSGPLIVAISPAERGCWRQTKDTRVAMMLLYMGTIEYYLRTLIPRLAMDWKRQHMG